MIHMVALRSMLVAPGATPDRRGRGPEWPTWLLIVAIYGGWALLTWYHAALPVWALAAMGGWVIAWQMSLQHELLHGHPTRRRWLNHALGFPPLNLWLPFRVYRSTHLRHHRDEHLTDPLEDPESYYLSPGRRLHVLHWRFLRLCNTVPGRLLLGPARVVTFLLAGEVRALLRGNREAWRTWPTHLLGVAAVLAWVSLVCRMSLPAYLALFVYPGVALTLLRSLAEHRAAPGVPQRTAVVENAPLMGLLYLHNNLHIVHHARPDLPWYRIPAWYRANRSLLLAQNGGLVYDGYGDVLRRYLTSPHHDPLHPIVGMKPAAPQAPAAPT